MFEKYFNRDFLMIDFPYFVPEEELEYNRDYAKRMAEEQWIYDRWSEDVIRGGLKRSGRFQAEAERIVSHGGIILEICAGPGGGFVPAILLQDYNANIMISDLCPTVVKEWRKLLTNLKNPPPNVEYAAFNVCDMPFADNSLDVISGNAAIINVEGNRDKALREVYRVLKPGGLFVFDFSYITKEFYENMPSEAQSTIKARYPSIFWDTLHVFDELGFSEIETIERSTWSNENDISTLADLCRSLDISLTFSDFVRYCIK